MTIGLVEIITLVFVVLAGIIDFKTMKIPNFLTFPFIVIGVLYSTLTGNIKVALIGLIISFVLGNIFFIIGGMGGGDVKLMMGIATILGLRDYLDILLIASLLGVLWGIISIMRRYFTMRNLAEVDLIYEGYFLKEHVKSQLFSRKEKTIVPFGTCLAMATIIYFVI